MEVKQQRTQAKTPKIIWRGSRKWRHDLFKLCVTTFQKNESWEKYTPKLVALEHTHIYHSVSRAGQPLTKSSVVGGHYHEVTTEVLPDGSMSATCGPPMRDVERRGRNGKMRVEKEPVRFLDGDDNRFITDNHTHEIEYLGSEMASEETMKLQAKQDQEKLRQLEEGRLAQEAQGK